MRIAILSDIHANQEALLAVLKKATTLGADKTICLGDIVGYGPEPNECIELLQERGALCIRGNHDEAAVGLREPDNFNDLARVAVLWTRAQLNRRSREFLISLPNRTLFSDAVLFHGAINEPDRYLISRAEVLENFNALAALRGDIRIGFFGHTHVQTAWIREGAAVSSLLSAQTTHLSPEKRYLINPGSTGQPRDGDLRAAFLVYDDVERTVLFYREEYDFRSCQEKIRAAGLPEKLAQRLAWGV
jgi:predicted phosphodiesterase